LVELANIYPKSSFIVKQFYNDEKIETITEAIKHNDNLNSLNDNKYTLGLFENLAVSSKLKKPLLEGLKTEKELLFNIDKRNKYNDSIYYNYLKNTFGIEIIDLNFTNISESIQDLLESTDLEYLIESTTKINNSSLLVLITFNSKKFLFTGDMDLAKLNDKSFKDLYFLKYPHHGSDSNFHKTTLDLMNPKYVFISGLTPDQKLKKYFGDPNYKYYPINKEYLRLFNSNDTFEFDLGIKQVSYNFYASVLEE